MFAVQPVEKTRCTGFYITLKIEIENGGLVYKTTAPGQTRCCCFVLYLALLEEYEVYCKYKEYYCYEVVPLQ